jgi:hypothetical protein
MAALCVGESVDFSGEAYAYLFEKLMKKNNISSVQRAPIVENSSQASADLFYAADDLGSHLPPADPEL